jgi:hypothetical protein
MEKKVMRKRNNFLLFIDFLCFVSGLTAQNTGYMGKRVMFNMGAEFSPAWIRHNFSENPNFQGRWYSFNYILSPSIEIITHKSGTAGIVYHYLSTRYQTPAKEDAWGEVIYSDSVYAKASPIVEKLTAHGFGIFYKQYMAFADGRSPVGPYVKLQFDGFFFKCPSSYDNRTIMMNDKLFALKAEIGNDFLLFNRLRLSTGFSIGLPFGGYKGLSYENQLLDWKSYSPHKPLNEYARSRIFGAYWISFTANIGFLAF